MKVVWITTDSEGKIRGVYTKLENAENALPAAVKQKKVQSSRSAWRYGKIRRYTIAAHRIEDSSGLPGATKV